MVVVFELRSLFLLLFYKAVVGSQVEENKEQREWKLPSLNKKSSQKVEKEHKNQHNSRHSLLERGAGLSELDEALL